MNLRSRYASATAALRPFIEAHVARCNGRVIAGAAPPIMMPARMAGELVDRAEKTGNAYDAEQADIAVRALEKMVADLRCRADALVAGSADKAHRARVIPFPQEPPWAGKDRA